MGEIATFSKGKGISKNEIVDNGETECIRYGELYTFYEEVISQIQSKTNTDISSLVLSEANDVIIPASGETQIDIATASCVLKSGVALGGDLNIIKTKNNGVFLSYYLNSKKKLEIAKLSQGISVVHLYSSQLALLNLKLPQFEEQKKLANFLSLLNSRIQTQKKIIEQLETLMKGSRINIFSQKLRFKDEQGYDFPDWKKLKLGEIGNFQTSSIDKLSKEDENEVHLVNYMNVYRHEDINSNTIKSFQKVTAKEQQINSCNLKKGDILFTPSSETPDDIGHSVVISENLENAVFSYHLMRFRPKIEIDILYSHYFCNVPIVLNQLSKFATGSTRFTISVKSFSDVEISLPSLSEQKIIGNFLSLIENKIKVEKQILEKLELQKKFLLANLFV